MKAKKTKIEILDDVVAHIEKQGGQAVDERDVCQYIAPDGKTCGHSMAINPHKREKAIGFTATTFIYRFGDKIHLVKYRGHDPGFWGLVQRFHDAKNNWTSEGKITEHGKNELNRLKDLYKN